VSGADPAAIYAASFVPSADALRGPLAELGQGLAGQLAELWARPSPERCERLSHNLDGALRQVRALREALLREGDGHGER
jgi:hypothetical protein